MYGLGIGVLFHKLIHLKEEHQVYIGILGRLLTLQGDSTACSVSTLFHHSSKKLSSLNPGPLLALQTTIGLLRTVPFWISTRKGTPNF